jgi:hypothetical protein
MPEKKLSRFGKKFKKARAKGKDTFKFRKKRLDLTEKRKTYTTATKDDLKKNAQAAVANADFERKTEVPAITYKKKAGPGFKHGGRVRDMFKDQYD